MNILTDHVFARDGADLIEDPSDLVLWTLHSVDANQNDLNSHRIVMDSMFGAEKKFSGCKQELEQVEK